MCVCVCVCACVRVHVFNECTKYIIPDEELYDGSNAPLINFIIYTYQGICAKHGIITNRLTLCKICEENDNINNGLIKRPTNRNKKQLYKTVMFYC